MVNERAIEDYLVSRGASQGESEWARGIAEAMYKANNGKDPSYSFDVQEELARGDDAFITHFSQGLGALKRGGLLLGVGGRKNHWTLSKKARDLIEKVAGAA